MPALTKECSHCRCELSLDAFGVDTSQRDELTRQCKACRSEMRKADYQRHREDRINAVAEYQRVRRAEIIERKRQRYAARKAAAKASGDTP